MLKRSFLGRPPRITFTHDFHELVRGDLVPGSTVVLRYDPLRIVPRDDGYVFGDPNRPIVAHAMFHPGEPPVSRTLHSPAGMLTHPDIDVTGDGNVLQGELAVPADAQEVVLWFTYASPLAGLQHDSDGGRNFHFGFASRQIAPLSADIDVDPQRQASAFSLRVAAVGEVDRVAVRVRAVNRADFVKADIDLHKTAQAENGWPVWDLAGVPVPDKTILQFKLYYWIGELRYKDDNDGLYYLAPQPAPERVPPPPAELARAAKAWG